MNRGAAPFGAVLGVLGVAGFLAAAFAGAPLAVQGGALGLGLLALGYAVVSAGRAAGHGEVIAHREVRFGTLAAAAERLGRRPLLRAGLLGGAALLGVGGGVLLRVFGPRAARGTGWEAGVHLVDPLGARINADAVPPGGVATVWPEGRRHLELTAAILVRLSARPALPPTRLEWVVNDTLVAYSKVCTHAGCPVGLFRERDAALFCPCHQATYDAARGASPTFGPAPQPLPQLPLGVDRDGFLIALSDFTVPVGPPAG